MGFGPVRLSQALTLQYDKLIFQPRAARPGQGGDQHAGERGRLPDGRLASRYKGVPLAYLAERFSERSAPWRSLG